jgi:hypothetical protein
LGNFLATFLKIVKTDDDWSKIIDGSIILQAENIQNWLPYEECRMSAAGRASLPCEWICQVLYIRTSYYCTS